MSSFSNTNRMTWVDAMRGFSMLLVVFGHVLAAMGTGGYNSFLSSVLLTFRLPLFFFVSGFFSYRVKTWWNRYRIEDILKRKFQAQILCVFVFSSVYQFVMTGGVNFSYGFAEYWFTIVLFQMYLIYLSLSLISRIFHYDIVIPCLLIISTLGIVTLAVYDRDSWIWNFLCWENFCKYIQFFTLGIICAKFKEQVLKLFENNIFILTMTVGWIVCMLLWYNDGFKLSLPLAYSFIHDIAVRYFALMTVVSFFYGYKSTFSNDSKMSSLLRFIGQRTLDIYMIHYFFIPNLSDWGTWLLSENRIIIQIIVASGVTIAIVAMSILISNILRRSRTIESWLFGVKQRKNA